ISRCISLLTWWSVSMLFAPPVLREFAKTLAYDSFNPGGNSNCRRAGLSIVAHHRSPCHPLTLSPCHPFPLRPCLTLRRQYSPGQAAPAPAGRWSGAGGNDGSLPARTCSGSLSGVLRRLAAPAEPVLDSDCRGCLGGDPVGGGPARGPHRR